MVLEKNGVEVEYIHTFQSAFKNDECKKQQKLQQPHKKNLKL